jgi:hypothetical protein
VRRALTATLELTVESAMWRYHAGGVKEPLGPWLDENIGKDLFQQRQQQPEQPEQPEQLPPLSSYGGGSSNSSNRTISGSSTGSSTGSSSTSSSCGSKTRATNGSGGGSGFTPHGMLRKVLRDSGALPKPSSGGDWEAAAAAAVADGLLPAMQGVSTYNATSTASAASAAAAADAEADAVAACDAVASCLAGELRRRLAGASTRPLLTSTSSAVLSQNRKPPSVSRERCLR